MYCIGTYDKLLKKLERSINELNSDLAMLRRSRGDGGMSCQSKVYVINLEEDLEDLRRDIAEVKEYVEKYSESSLKK